MLEAFLWGVFASASLVLGALVVQVRAPSSRALGLILGFGAGVLISAVSFELVEEAVETSGALGGTALGFLTGAVTFFVGDTLLARRGDEHGDGQPHSGTSAGALALVLGIVLDGIPESAVLGLTLIETGEIGVAMVVAVFVSNLPESIAATTDLLESGWTRSRVYLLWVGVALVCALAAALGYGLLSDASPRTVAFVLAFAGGAILCMLSTTMVPEGYERASRATGLATTLGFAIAFAINWAAA